MSEPDCPRKSRLPLEVARRLDPLCDRFEDDWLAGRRPRLEEFLDRVPQADRPAMLGELLGLELDYRLRRGEHPEAEDYRRRFPGCDEIVEASFAALTVSSDALAPTFYTSPPRTEVKDTRPEAADAAPPPRQAGRYLIEGEIGRGGMGVVLRARDPDLHRPLAVKILLAAHAHHADLERRFRAEAQITGQLQHPGIPPIHEVGVLPDGRPFFAMKLIEGRTLADLLRQRRQPAEDLPPLLAIFGQVCQTLAYAHSKGVIHRDLKPSNVMVGTFGEVQVMDWGLAKLRSEDRSTAEAGSADPAGTIVTVWSGASESASRPGSLLGTPAYMAPEQARGEVDLLDERCDVFGLGALLCEILTGQPPYADPNGNEALRRARCGDLAEALGRLEQCGADAALTVLCRECLVPERTSRPRDAEVVARRVADYQAEVQERLRRAELERAQALVKAREERKRRRLAVAAVLLLLSGTAVSTWQAVRATVAEGRATQSALAEGKARQAAQDRLGQIEKANDVLASIFHDLDPTAEAKGGPDLREQLNQHLQRAAAQLDESAIGEPLMVARLQNTLGKAFIGLGQARQAMELLGKARTTRESHLGPDHADTLISTINLASAYQDTGQLDKAIPLLMQTLQRQKATLGPDHLRTLATMNNLATAYRDAGQLDEAVSLYELVLEKEKVRPGPNDAITLITLGNLATAYQDAGQPERAVPMLERVLENWKIQFGPDHPYTLTSMNNLASAYQAGQPEKAVPLFEQVLRKRQAKLGPDHPATLTSMNNLATAYRDSGRLDKALPLLEQTLEKTKARLGPDHADTLMSMNNLATAYRDARRLDKAIALHEQTLARRKALLGPDHPDTLVSTNNLATAYYAAGQLDKALPLLEQTLVKLRTRFGPDHPHTLGGMSNLATAYRDAGKLDREEALLRELLLDRRKKAGPESPAVAGMAAMLGMNLLEQKKYADAEPVLRECLAIRAKTQPDDWATFNARSSLGGALLGRKRYAEAEPLLLEGYEGMKRREAKIPPQGKPRLAEALGRLVQLYEATSNIEEAAKWRKLWDEAKKAAAKAAAKN